MQSTIARKGEKIGVFFSLLNFLKALLAYLWLSSTIVYIYFLVIFFFTGSPSGKLTVAEHRQSVLSALQSLSLCPLSASGQREVATLVTRTLMAHIKQEGGL